MEVSYTAGRQRRQDPRRRSTSIGLKDVSVQTFGTSRDILIRMPLKSVEGIEPERRDAEAVRRGDAGAQGPGLQRGAEARRVRGRPGGQGARHRRRAWRCSSSVIGIVIYLAFRFEWRFAVATIIANLHDVVIILGFFAFFQWEFSLPVLAAMLAVFGYSVNESVVVFDRVRENFRKMRKASVREVMDASITGHDLAHDHHARLHADDGAVDLLLRRARACTTSRSRSPSASASASTRRCWWPARSRCTSAPRARTS